MTVRETASVKPGLGTQFSKVAHRASPDVVVGRGNHEITGTSLEPLPAWRPILGLHFPVRSFAQFEGKVVRDGHAVANNPDPKVSLGICHDRYELYEAGGLPDRYAQMVVEDAQVDAGVREGRLAIDDRLKRYFAGGTGGAPELTLPIPSASRRSKSICGGLCTRPSSTRWRWRSPICGGSCEGPRSIWRRARSGWRGPRAS